MLFSFLLFIFYTFDERGEKKQKRYHCILIQMRWKARSYTQCYVNFITKEFLQIKKIKKVKEMSAGQVLQFELRLVATSTAEFLKSNPQIECKNCKNRITFIQSDLGNGVRVKGTCLCGTWLRDRKKSYKRKGRCAHFFQLKRASKDSQVELPQIKSWSIYSPTISTSSESITSEQLLGNITSASDIFAPYISSEYTIFESNL